MIALLTIALLSWTCAAQDDGAKTAKKAEAGHGALAKLDPALLVTPPQGLETGYVPIVTAQSAP